jgi:cytochrome c
MFHLPKKYRALSAVSIGMLFMLAFQSAMAATPLPEIPKARASVSDTQQCVEPVDEMRKNHMNYILHQRDETVHRGIRTRQHSLEECINCHAVTGPDGEFVRKDSDKHFCSSCHNYASVSIDCFQCHADRPTRESTLPQLDNQSAIHHPAPAAVQDTLSVITAEGRLQ